MPDPAIDQQNQAPAAPAAQAPQPPPPPDMEAAPEPVKPDGGVLGHAVVGALTKASAPPDMQAAPADMQAATDTNTSTPPEHSWWDTAKKVLMFNPLLTPIHYVAGKDAEAVQQKVHDRDQANLVAASHGMQSPYSTIGTQALRDAGGVADVVGGATSPAAAAMATAAATGPIGATATGLYMVGHGLYNMVQGWGDISNPDVLQNELNSAAETVAGVDGLTEGAKGVVKAYKAKTANTPDLQYTHFKNAVPPGKTTPYTELDYHAARPYLDAEHTTGTPIEGIASTVEAADSAIEKIEGKVATVVKANPDVLVHVNPLREAQEALRGSVRTDFFEAGMNELEKYPLGFERSGGVTDEPLTLQKADDIRRQLNDDNRSLMKSKNNYDIGNMMNTDPAFAARQAAAQALRTGIYDTLEQLGLKDARQIRMDEGSLIKIRNAAERQRFNAEKSVKNTAKPGIAKRAAKKAATGIGAAAGFEFGAKVGHPLVGASVGAEVGSEAAKALTPKALTRDELIQKAFEPLPKPAGPVGGGPGLAGAVGAAANRQEVPKGFLHIRGSDGGEFFIPEEQLGHIHEIDPGLTIVNQ